MAILTAFRASKLVRQLITRRALAATQRKTHFKRLHATIRDELLLSALSEESEVRKEKLKVP
jgi:hypothetical protein